MWRAAKTHASEFVTNTAGMHMRKNVKHVQILYKRYKNIACCQTEHIQDIKSNLIKNGGRDYEAGAGLIDF